MKFTPSAMSSFSMREHPVTKLSGSFTPQNKEFACVEIPIKTTFSRSIFTPTFEVESIRSTMRLSVCFTFLLLFIALARAGPAPKIIGNKALEEEPKLESKKTDLKIEETGADKDRSKKSTASFCVQIQSGSSQPIQVPCKNNQASVQTLPYTIQTQPGAQLVQTVNTVQPLPQMAPASIMVPQQVVQPVHTLQIVQTPQQPCAQSIPAVNIIQSVPQTSIVENAPKPKPKPKPVPSVVVVDKPEEPKPERIMEPVPEPLPEPQETLTVLPIARPCHEHLTVPSSPVFLLPDYEQAQLATIVQVPSTSPCSNPLHGVLSPCTCQTANVAMLSDSTVEPLAMKMLPLSYSIRRSSGLTMPHNSMMLTPTVDNLGTVSGSQGRNSAMVKVNLAPHSHLHHGPAHHHTVFQKMYLHESGIPSYASSGLMDNMYATRGVAGTSELAMASGLRGISGVGGAVGVSGATAASGTAGVTVNAYPTIYRSANPTYLPENSLKNEENASNNPVMSETIDMVQSNKTPRDIKSTQMVPEKQQPIEQKDQAQVVDGRRNARSNKDNAKTTN